MMFPAPIGNIGAISMFASAYVPAFGFAEID